MATTRKEETNVATDLPTASLVQVGSDGPPGHVIERILALAREELDTEVAFVAEFTGGSRVFRYVNGDVESFGIEVDAGDPLEETYCQRIAQGTLDAVVADARSHALTRDLPVTERQGIGSHIGVPIVLSDGRVFGTFCAANHAANWTLRIQQVMFLRVAAALVADQVEREELVGEDREAAAGRIRQVLDDGGPTMFFQPIVELGSRRLLGVEALARFEVESRRPPNVWFDEAWLVGLGQQLELAAFRNALQVLDRIDPAVYLSINFSHETLLSDDYLDVLAGSDPSRVVVEITEHSRIFNYGRLRASMGKARSLGARLAIDDLGAGFSGLRHLVELAPDILKMDRSLVEGVATDRLRRIVTQSLISTGQLIGASVVAEGIETPAELSTLRSLGVRAGQGFLLAKPHPLPPTGTHLLPTTRSASRRAGTHRRPRSAVRDASRWPPAAIRVAVMTGIAKYSVTALDCRDPRALAEFYAAITGWDIDDEGGDWVELISDGGPTLAFQQDPDHQPPVWPSSDRSQQAHLDFDVDDLDAAEEQVLALGARKAEVQPGDSFRVFLDPAGHPFCLVRSS